MHRLARTASWWGQSTRMRRFTPCIDLVIGYTLFIHSTGGIPMRDEETDQHFVHFIENVTHAHEEKQQLDFN